MSKFKFEVKISVVEKGRRKPEYTIDSDQKGELTLADLLRETKQLLIVTADEALKDEQSKGFDKEPVLVVDGRQSKPITAVHPLGQIEFVARSNFGEILIETFEGLFHRSKVLKGDYITSHVVAYNGRQVADSITSLRAWLNTNPPFKNGDTVRIVNTQPYARRLELLGVTKQRTNQVQQDAGRRAKKKTGTMVKVPNGAYQLTFRSIKAKYKQNVRIRFNFLPGSSLGLAGSFKSGRKGKNSIGRPYLYPTIVFDIDTRGIK